MTICFFACWKITQSSRTTIPSEKSPEKVQNTPSHLAHLLKHKKIWPPFWLVRILNSFVQKFQNKRKKHTSTNQMFTLLSWKKAIYWVKIEINFLQHSFKSHTSHIRLSEAPPKRKKITHLKTPSHSNEKMSFLCTILHIKGYTKNTSWLKCG